MRKVKTRLIPTVGSNPERMRSILFSRASTSAAPMRPKMAPEAPAERLFGSIRAAPREPPSSEAK